MQTPAASALPLTEDLSSAWQRLSDHFEVLYDTPETLAHLRQSILQLAVQGKLVPQDPSDEPASDLIEKIRARKATLVRDKKVRKPKPFAPISDDDLLPLPASWQWIRLGELIESLTNGLYKHSTYYTDDGTACIRMYNIQEGCLDLSKVQRLNLAEDEIRQYRLETNDLIVNRVNSRELVGKTAVINGLAEPFVFEAMNIRVRFLEKDGIPDYANLLFRTDRIRELFQTDAKQASGQASISQPQVANIAVPLPPLAEQKRIVAKVDQLLSQCDELSARLRDRQSATQQLLTATIHHLLNGVGVDE